MKVLTALGLVVAGSVVAIATVALHQLWWGMLLGLAATVATLVALPRGWWSRLAFSVGWVALVGWATLPGPGGGYLIASDTAGYVLLAAALVVLMAGLATLPRPRRRVQIP